MKPIVSLVEQVVANTGYIEKVLRPLGMEHWRNYRIEYKGDADYSEIEGCIWLPPTANADFVENIIHGEEFDIKKQLDAMTKKHDELASIIIASGIKTQKIEREVINPRIRAATLKVLHEIYDRCRERFLTADDCYAANEMEDLYTWCLQQAADVQRTR